MGAFILNKFGSLEISVNLTRPDFTFFIEIRENDVILFHEKYKGMGGLPRDSTSYVIGTIGLTSSSWKTHKLLLKRGTKLFFLLLSPILNINGRSRISSPP